MKTIIVCVLFVFIEIQGFGQSPTYGSVDQKMDSLKFAHFQNAALKYPTLRQASVSTDFVSAATVRSKLQGNELFSGKAQFIRTRAHFTLPISTWGKNTVSSTFGMVNEHINLSNVTNPQSWLGIRNMETNFTTFNFSASYSRSDSLFNRPVTYSVLVTGLTNASLNRIRVTSAGFVSVNLIRNPMTSLSVGIVLISDRSSVVPAYLLVSYSRKFAGLGLELLADLPSRITLRKEFSPKSFVSVGSELGGSLFFFNLKEPSLPANAISTALIIKSGVTYERIVAKNVILGVSAGILSSPMIKALDKKGSASDYFIKTKSSNEPYLNVSLSFLPFWKGLRL